MFNLSVGSKLIVSALCNFEAHHSDCVQNTYFTKMNTFFRKLLIEIPQKVLTREIRHQDDTFRKKTVSRD